MQLVGLVSVAEYHALIDSGEIDEKCELLEGVIVPKMSQNSRHRVGTQGGWQSIYPLLPRGWSLQIQAPVTLHDSEPEPDIAVYRGSLYDYPNEHPKAEDTGLVIEVADSTLAKDRGQKARIYASAGIPVYWIANVVDDVVEVRRKPVDGVYTEITTYRPGDDLPIELDGREVARIPVDAFLVIR